MFRFKHLLFSLILGLSLAQLGAEEVIVEYDFESGLQGWSNPGGTFGWRHDSGGTPSSITGPSIDASGSSSGYYVYLETSNGSGPYTAGQESYFVSPSLSWVNSELEFAYHMYGATMGTLYLEVSTNSGSTWTTEWSINGQQHTSSSQAYTITRIDLTGYSGQTLQIRFRGESTITGYQGDMAIDAVKVIQSGPPQLAIIADSEFLEGSSGLAATVSVDTAPSSDLTVSLSGDSYLSLPATVTIPGGQNSVVFTFAILDDTDMQGDRAASITASAIDFPSVVHNLTVYDDESPFTVTFDLNGKASRTGGGALVQSLLWGEFPVLPEISDDPGWLFTGWDPVDPAGSPVSADRMFTGQFVSAHTVTFDLGIHGTLVSGSLQQIVADQAPVAIPDFSITENWEFSRWDDTFFNPQRVTRDHSVVAQYVPSPVILHSQVGAIEGSYRDSLGTSVDIDGGTAVVGAPNADSNLGAIYVYQSGETGWQLEATLTAPTRSTSDYFGGSVKIDGDIILVGSSYDDSIINDAGCAYIYTRSAGVWSGGEKITASDAEESDYFGRYIAVGAGRLIISATGNDDVGSSSGSVYIFENDGSGWTETLKLLPSDLASGDLFGSAVAIDGDRILVGASGDDDQGYGSGSAYIFSYDGSNLTQTAKLTASDGASLQYLGYSVSLEGDTAVVGTYTAETNTGAVYVYQLEAAVWTETKLTATDRLAHDYFGYSLSISGDTLLVGARSTREGGHAYVYLNLDGQWIQAAKIVPGSARSFGSSVAVDAGSAIVGAPNPNGEGEAFFYDLSLTSPTVIFDLGANGTRDGGGALTQVLDLGQSATEPIVAAATGWTFTGWDTSFDDVYYDRTVTAQYSVQTYDVSFDLDAKGERTGGGELSQSIAAGSTAVAPEIGALPGWLFTGWNMDFSNVQSDLTVVAQYLPAHTVTFDLGGSGTHNGGGELSQSVEHGTAAVAPTFDVTAGWRFTGWDADFSSITGNLTVTAQYVRIFTVTFELDGKASRIGEGELVQVVDEGESALTPTLSVNPAWAFDRWDVAFDAVTSDLTVTALYSPVLYTVTFDLGAHGTRTGGGELNQSIQHGNAAVAPTVDANTGRAFDGWDADFSSVTSDLTVTAQYLPIHTVTFVLGTSGIHTGGGALSQSVIDGQAATEPMIDVVPGSVFDRWSDDFSSITSDIVVSAFYFDFPEIEVGAFETILSSGSNGFFEISANGGGLTYQWYQGETGETVQPISGATGPTLVFHPLYEDTDYWVRVHNAAGAADSPTMRARITEVQPNVLLGMGSGYWGQLGSGISDTVTSPLIIDADIADISAGRDHTLYVKNDRTLWAMGKNHAGQLGDGTQIDRIKPVLVANNVVAARTGANHSLFLKADGTLWGMGYNYNGELGVFPNSQRLNPVHIASNVVSISAGDSHSLYRTSNGYLWGMGSNSSGQLGGGVDFQSPKWTPELISTAVTSQAAAGRHSLYVVGSSLRGMGYGYYGQLGDHSSSNPAVSTYITNNVRAVETSSNNTYFIKYNGTLWALGSNSHGQLGIGEADTTRTPVLVASNVASVSAGGNFGLYVDNNGVLWGMGGNVSGELGMPSIEKSDIPVQIARGVDLVSAGSNYSLFVKTDGTLWVMGSHEYGKLGDGSVRDRIMPSFITDDVTRISASNHHSLFVKADKSLWSMGANYSGQLGDGTTTGNSFPTHIANDVVSVFSGAARSFFLKTDGSLWAMGSNSLGALGDGTTINHTTPVEIATGVVSVASGDSHTLYVKNDGSLWAVGYNYSGQLGDGSTTSRENPKQIDSGVVYVSACESHSLYVKSDGSLWGMGANNNNQLGALITTKQKIPKLIAEDVILATTGDWHSLFIKTDGTLWGMGSRVYGGLGLAGNPYDRVELPEQITTDVVYASAGNQHSIFVKNDGSLWGMGRNVDGRLGDFSLSDIYLPLQIDTSVTSASAGMEHSLYLVSSDSVNIYSVTFDLGSFSTRTGGGLLGQKVTGGGLAVPPRLLELEGHLFTGWDTDFSNVTTDLTVSAQYIRDTMDSDADGLFDFWERLHFPSLESVDGTTDSDGDGSDNRAESIAGTDPNDQNSIFGLTDLVDTSEGMSVTLPTVADRTYEVFWSTDLVNWTSDSIHAGTGGELNISLDRAAIDAADGISGNLGAIFVRVGVSRP